MPVAAMYPGTFDPITLGHEDLVRRAAGIFERVVVAIAADPGSKATMFSIDERVELARTALKGVDHVEVRRYGGLTVDFAQANELSVIIRGLRAVADFEYEFQMSLMNRKLNEEVETVFLMPAQEYIHLNSTIIKEVASFNGDISEYVPKNVEDKLNEKYGR